MTSHPIGNRSANSQQHGADIKRRDLLLGASSLLTVSAMTSLPRYGARRTQGVHAGDDFPRPDRPHDRRVDAGVAGAGARQAGRAERAVHRHRRHGLRPARLLRRADQHAEPRSARPERPALHQHAHDGALFADALVHPHGPQSSFERHVVHHRGRGGLSRLQRRDSVRERLSLRDACSGTATTRTRSANGI